MTEHAELMERLERLNGELAALRDPHARETAEAMISAVLELHGQGLARILELVGPEGAEPLVADGVVASLLLIHDLYPVGLEERVLAALESVRPYLESHGGDVELVGLDDGVARLRLVGSCETCSASADTLELAVKRAIEEAAPDLLDIEVVGAPEPVGMALPMATADVALAQLDATVAAATTGPAWIAVEGVGALPEGGVTAVDVAGQAVVVANAFGTLLAYLDACARCGEPISSGTLHGGVLGCSACGLPFDLPRAGRSTEGDHQLRPIPLLRGAGTAVRVAVAR